jgi:NAD(P)-dependent dehydrogenase (short-subunit alcohol dehydrogenase family)
MDFAGRHVVVTGASGALGEAVTTALLERGAVCHLPVRGRLDPDRFPSTARERVHVMTAVEILDDDAVRGFYASLPGLWASIHCVGGFAMAPMIDTSLEDFTGLWGLNATSAFLCSREAARRMVRSAGRGGRIVNVAARAALEPRSAGGMVAYAAAKAAVAAMTQALSEELAPHGIWVNAVAPSILDTPANRQALPAADHEAWPKLDEVAATIVFLASPANRATRGGVIPAFGRV